MSYENPNALVETMSQQDTLVSWVDRHTPEALAAFQGNPAFSKALSFVSAKSAQA